MSKRRSASPAIIPDMPAAVKEGHVQEIRGAHRGRYRQTKSNHLRCYADAGQISEEQFRAAEWYEERFLTIHKSPCRDSTDVDARFSSDTSRAPLTHLYVEMARAAITAMREPTDSMEEAAWYIDASGRDHVGSGAKPAWRTMIDAALKEEV